MTVNYVHLPSPSTGLDPSPDLCSSPDPSPDPQPGPVHSLGPTPDPNLLAFPGDAFSDSLAVFLSDVLAEKVPVPSFLYTPCAPSDITIARAQGYRRQGTWQKPPLLRSPILLQYLPHVPRCQMRIHAHTFTPLHMPVPTGVRVDGMYTAPILAPYRLALPLSSVEPCPSLSCHIILGPYRLALPLSSVESCPSLPCHHHSGSLQASATPGADMDAAYMPPDHVRTEMIGASFTGPRNREAATPNPSRNPNPDPPGALT